MGLLILQLLKVLKIADEITVIEPIQLKRKIAMELGADSALSPSDDLSILKKTEAVFECVGGYNIEKTINLALDFVGPRGKIILVGSVEVSPKIRLGTLHTKEVSIIGAYTLTFNEFKEALMLADKIKLKPLITHIYPLKDINNAIKTALSPHAIKVIVKP